ncbi:glycosyltransferase family 2 protein [Frigoribacterium faeni]|uniref:Glycosyltransferase 2-like domain-containing protein n=1 Tax=Frigoribacterium faeni TaxID=145483 RepID=A0A7W3JG94_9MICO|nr:glycosyltransferase family 2 protein [Frigoribacterium faeni]MBA8812289.1 hypothetical protein [Frigoribacterium faeni]BFF13337.1 hypothetical protein GCM10025699_46400 [Microbacterium flavescens]GEK83139.1 hypothetical protein FFA01_14480 [Frigoribacterium faeni]
MSTETLTPTPVPLLSVVVPVHDVATWLTECLDTIAAQQVDLEVLVIDDHSTDGSLAVARRHAAADPRFRVVEAVERGGAAARDLGVSLARGRYLVFADGDDLVPRGAYRALVEALESSGDDVAVGDFLKFDARSTWRPSDGFDAFATERRGASLADVPSLLRFRACWHKLFRLDRWRELGVTFPSVPRSNDIVPMTTVLTRASSISVVTDVVYAYRDRPGHGSMTRRAGQLVGTLSYFDQEARCAELVVADGREAVASEYFSMVLVNDGWVHLRKLMAGGPVEIDDDRRRALGASVSALLEQAPPELVGRLGATQRRLYRLVATGRADLLWSMPDVPGSTDDVPVDGAEATTSLSRAVDLVDVLRGLGEHGTATTVVERRVVPHLIAIAGLGSSEAHDTAASLASRIPADAIPASSSAVVRLAREGSWPALARLADVVRDVRVDVTGFERSAPVVVSTGAPDAGTITLTLRHETGTTATWTTLTPGATSRAALPRLVRTTPGRWTAQVRVDLRGSTAEVPARASRPALQRPDGALAPVVVAQVDAAGDDLVFVTRSRLMRRLAGAVLRRARSVARRVRR